MTRVPVTSRSSAPVLRPLSALASLVPFALQPLSVLAARPDEGGGWASYDDSDVLAFVDGPSGRVRVHFSVQGPNATILDDDDGSGAPDFPEEVARTAESALLVFEEAGFRSPVSEDAAGLGDLGGSDAFDYYLVDFGGSADGQFSVDGCGAGVCAGHMLMENDFRGSGYASLSSAIRVLVSHETFHAVQAAYATDLEVWVSEGTAVWAEKLFDDASEDFRWFAGAYLEDTERSIDRPPVGPVPAFAYGSCLFWEFLSLRHGTGVLALMLERGGDLDGLEESLEEASATLDDEWVAFGAANLTTGPRTGPDAFYPFAAEIDGIEEPAASASIREEERFHPLAASYFLLAHAGGEIWFAATDDPTGLVLGLHRDRESVVDMEPVISWAPTGGEPVSLGDLAAGDYWLRATNPRREGGIKVTICLGAWDATAPCVTDHPDAGPPAGADSGTDLPDAGVATDDEDVEPGTTGSAGCRASGPGARPSLLPIAALLALGLRFRSRSRGRS